MARARFTARMLMAIYLAGILLLMGVAGLVATVPAFSLAIVGLTLASGSILWGWVWMIIGYLLGNMPSSYLGPASYSGRPIAVVSSRFLADSNPDVIKDLRGKLADPGDPSVFLIGLGALTFVLGVVAVFNPVVGLLALGILAVAVGAVLVVPRRSAVPGP